MTIFAVLEEELVASSLPPPGAPAMFIAVGSNDGQFAPVLMTTEYANATTWVDRSSSAAVAAPSAVLQDICYSNATGLNRWVAVGYDTANFGDPVVIYSDDGGNTWSSATPAPTTNFMINSVCWTGAAFIAAGKITSGNTPVVMSSADGVTWTQRTSAPTTSVAWKGVDGVSGLAVAVGGVNSPIIMTSSNNGTSWTQHSPSAGSVGQLQDVVCVSGGTHVAVGFSVTSARGGVDTSTNGTTWTELSSGLPGDQQYYGVAYNGSIYVAVGSDFNTSFEGRAASSTAPASTWTARTTAPVTAASDNGPNWLSVAAIAGGGFVAVGRDNNGFNIPYIMYSADGITWSARTPDPASNAILMGVGSSG